MRVSFWDSLTPSDIFNFSLLILVLIGTIVSFVISLKKKKPYASRFWMIIYSIYAIVHIWIEKSQFNSPYYSENYGNTVQIFYTVIIIVDILCLIIAVLGTFFLKKQIWISVCIIVSGFIILFQSGLIFVFFNFVTEIIFCAKKIDAGKADPVEDHTAEVIPENPDTEDTYPAAQDVYPDPDIPDIFCGYCGQKNPSEAEFCGKCGKPIVKLT